MSNISQYIPTITLKIILFIFFFSILIGIAAFYEYIDWVELN